MQSLSHSNVCQLYEIYEDDVLLYFVMEACVGGTLFERLEADIVLEESMAERVASQMLSAIAHLHDKNVIHRDLRPESWLMIDFDPESPLKLTNFGLAEICDPKGVGVGLSQPC